MISPVLSKFCPHYWAGIESPVLSLVLNKYYPQYWTGRDKVGSDQCETARCDALLLRREVHFFFQFRIFCPFLRHLVNVTLPPTGSAIAWSWCAPRQRISWATSSSTWSTSHASSSPKSRSAPPGTGGAGGLKLFDEDILSTLSLVRCTLKEEKPVAIWKKPLPYWNRSVWDSTIVWWPTLWYSTNRSNWMSCQTKRYIYHDHSCRDSRYQDLP